MMMMMMSKFLVTAHTTASDMEAKLAMVQACMFKIMHSEVLTNGRSRYMSIASSYWSTSW